MRKLISVLLAMTIIFSLLAGCGSKSTSNESKKPEPASSAKVEEKKEAPVKLTILHYMGEETKRKGLKAMCDAITAKYPNITFDIQAMAYAQYTGLLKTKISAGDAPDIIFGKPREFMELVKAGQIMDISGQAFLKNVSELVLEETTVDGKNYAVPIDIQATGVFYNKEMFEKQGLKAPATFTEFINACEKFKAAGIVPLSHGYKNTNQPNTEVYSYLMPMVEKNSANIFEIVQKGQKKLADYPEFKDAMQKYDKILKYKDPGDFGIDPAQALADFASGKRPMYINGGWIIGDVRATNPSGKFGFFPMPGTDNAAENKTPIGIDDVFMASAQTKNKEAVLKFFEFLASPDGAKLWVANAKLMSSIKGVELGEADEMVKDISKCIADKRYASRLNVQEFTGEHKQKFRASLHLFASKKDEERNVDKYIAEEDKELSAIK